MCIPALQADSPWGPPAAGQLQLRPCRPRLQGVHRDGRRTPGQALLEPLRTCMRTVRLEPAVEPWFQLGRRLGDASRPQDFHIQKPPGAAAAAVCRCWKAASSQAPMTHMAYVSRLMPHTAAAAPLTSSSQPLSQPLPHDVALKACTSTQCVAAPAEPSATALSHSS